MLPSQDSCSILFTSYLHLLTSFTIVPVTTAWKADKFYQMILAALLNGVILSILFAIVFTMCHLQWVFYSNLSKPLAFFEKVSL